MYKKFSFIILVLLLFCSCSLFKKTSKTTINSTDNYFIIDSIINYYLDYTTLNIKYSAKLESEKNNYNFSGQIRLKKDSICWINASPALGIEVARLVFTSDSIKLLNRFENNYSLTNYNFLKKTLKQDLDFNTLQSILTNQLVFFPFKNFDISEYKYSQDSTKHYLIYKSDTISFITHNITINKLNNKVEQITTQDTKENKKLIITYSDFYMENEKMFPKKINIEAINKTEKLNINLEYQKINIDKEVSFPFNIPDKYEKIDL